MRDNTSKYTFSEKNEREGDGEENILCEKMNHTKMLKSSLLNAINTNSHVDSFCVDRII
jgi:hypothetical protein